MKRFVIMLIGCAFASSAFAATKAGLWQVTTATHFNSGGPNISPGEAEQMKKFGIRLPFAEPKTSKYCVSPEQAAKDEPPDIGEKQGCKRTGLKKTTSAVSVDMVCDGEIKGKGHMDVRYDGSSAYVAKINLAGTSSRFPVPVDVTMDASGKWLGADCGDVKPMKQK